MLPVKTDRHECAVPSEYAPGEFYRRELPVLTALIDRYSWGIHTVLVDGYVDLDAYGSPGLGRYLYRHYESTMHVVGVAKSRFKDSNHAIEILRARSRRPLYVTSAGIPNNAAADKILTMAGQTRLPTMIKLADSIARNTPHA